MTQLQQQFISVANEYARQFGKIIGYRKEFWSSIIDGHPSINLFSWLKGARPSLTNKTKKS